MTRLLTDSDKVTLLNQTLDTFFEHSIKNAAAIDPSYRRLWDAMHDLIQSGGKRLRPLMTMQAYEIFGGKEVETIIPVAAAQELLHFSLLIHDDVIDRDYMRYGTLNVAGRYKETYADYLTNDQDKIHFAHSAAVLGGDLMLSAAHQLIGTSKLSDTKKTVAQQLLSKSVFEVAGGELLDTESSFTPYTAGDALKIARYKTAGYSFATPLLTGAKIAGITDEDAEELERFAISLGIAFQLVDDLLGVFGEQETTGKSTTSDITEGKRTFMVERAVAAMSHKEKQLFDKSFGDQQAAPEEIAIIKQLLISTGAKAATEDEIGKYAAEADDALRSLKLSEKHQEELEKLIKRVTERAY